jgi:hypothetical protein
MAKQTFIQRRPRRVTMEAIEQANAIIAEYLPQGYVLTLRQLYYQFVARGLLPENSLKEYKRIGVAVSLGRDVGEIDWDAIEDRSRAVNNHTTWSSPADILHAAAESYREDLWVGQKFRPEVWIEKDALIGVIERACTDYRVPYFATRGNCSQSAVYEAGRRFFAHMERSGQIPIVIYLSDHDPNGIDMARDIERRLERYARAPIPVERVALTMKQVRRFRPPPNFAKEADPHLPGYVKQFGTDQCWELDALSPTVIDQLVREKLATLVDADAWRRAERREQRGQRRLKALATNGGSA